MHACVSFEARARTREEAASAPPKPEFRRGPVSRGLVDRATNY